MDIEVLVIAFAELIGALVFLAAQAAIVSLELVGVVAGTIIEAVCTVATSRGSTTPLVSAAVSRAQPRVRHRRILKTSAVVGVVMAVVTLGVDAYGKSAMLRWYLDGFTSRSGIHVEFQELTGLLLGGKIQASGVRIHRAGHSISNFDLTLTKVEMSASIWQLIRSHRLIQIVRIDELVGSFERIDQPQAKSKPKPFVIGNLNLANSRVRITDRTLGKNALEYDVVIQSLTCERFVSSTAVFSLLFRSNTIATLNGQPIEFHHGNTKDGHRILWRGRGLSLPIAGAYLGTPLNWFKAGELDVSMDFDFRSDEFVAASEFVLLNPQIEVPKELPLVWKAMGKAAAIYLNERDRVELRFKLQPGLAESSFDAQEFWAALSQAANTAFRKRVMPLGDR